MKLVEIVAIPPSTLTLTEGEQKMLKVTIYPEDATYTHVTWSSSDPTVASVDSHGVVYANSAGEAVITARAADTSGKYDECTVTVNAPYVPVTGITLNKSSMTLKRGEQGTLTATVLPENATRNTVSWSSSNSYIASVANGVVTANKRGEAVITAMCSDGHIYGDTCNVTVESNGMVESITLDRTSATLNINSQLQLIATVLPSDATNKALQWTSSNTKVASVNSSTGLVTARSKGTAVITARATDGSGVFTRCSINVYVPVKSITLDKSEMRIVMGGQGTLKASVLPANANNKSYRWVSDNETVAKVVDGVVTGRGIGNTTVYAISDEPTGVRGLCKVYVAPLSAAVQSIAISPSEKVMVKGETATLQAAVLPASAYNKDITWSSSNTSVVTVQPSGLIRAVGEGEVTITATAQDGSGVTGSCVVRVVEQVTIEYNGSDTVFIFSSGRTWKYIGCEIGIDCLQEDRDRHAHNCAQHFSTKELAYLYLFDPLGIEEYMKDYTDIGTPQGEALLFKDDLYKEIFGVRPRFFRQAGETIFYYTNDGTTSAEERKQYHSDAELIFGSHNIFDALAWASCIISVGIELLGEIPGVSEAMITVDVIKALFFSGSLTDAIMSHTPGLATEFFGDYIEDYETEFPSSNTPAKVGLGMLQWWQRFANYGEAFFGAFCPDYTDIQIYRKIQSQNILACFKVSEDSTLTMEDIISSLGEE